MSDIKGIVLETYREILEENNLSIIPDLLNAVEKDTGLDSLGIVNLIIAIEDKLDLSLDPILADIRRSPRLIDIAEIIQNFIIENNN